MTASDADPKADGDGGHVGHFGGDDPCAVGEQGMMVHGWCRGGSVVGRDELLGGSAMGGGEGETVEFRGGDPCELACGQGKPWGGLDSVEFLVEAEAGDRMAEVSGGFEFGSVDLKPSGKDLAGIVLLRALDVWKFPEPSVDGGVGSAMEEPSTVVLPECSGEGSLGDGGARGGLGEGGGCAELVG